jgi:hypothetical protein
MNEEETNHEARWCSLMASVVQLSIAVHLMFEP